ncbi:hypothetical protein M422DRAFT_255969 [Sphaerobolus stellatus SS14]|uniref:Uncharacterized protein n=1 Tax=Sphaerobolus stellatus (strain SS14) TaxID=990650 RepID=A0A0C9VRX0_SPHS4|nr:hypothetical protein M422DRAFT_255969 [Sphaerobolus stellatus SS14]
MLAKAFSIKLDSKNSPKSFLLKEIIRDSILFFVTNLTILLANAVIWTSSQSAGIIFSALALFQAMPSVLGSRLLINIRTSQERMNITISPAPRSLYGNRGEKKYDQ